MSRNHRETCHLSLIPDAFPSSLAQILQVALVFLITDIQNIWSDHQKKSHSPLMVNMVKESFKRVSFKESLSKESFTVVGSISHSPILSQTVVNFHIKIFLVPHGSSFKSRQTSQSHFKYCIGNTQQKYVLQGILAKTEKKSQLRIKLK